MKGLLRWLGAVVLLVGISMNVRSAGVTDLLDLCTGANQSNCPFKIDASGNITAVGNITTTGKITSTSASATTIPNLTSSTQLTIAGFQSYSPPTTQFQIGASTAIVPSSSYMVLGTTGPASTIEITATPSISTATAIGGSTAFTDGTILVLTSTGGVTSVTVADNSTLAGSQLRLGSAYRQIGPDKVLTLMYSALRNFWVEVSYANNN